MPEIPLFNGGQSVKTGNLPEMPLDRERRPRVDFGGIIAGLGRVSQGQEGLVNASAPPLISPDAFKGLDRGTQALAQGIMQGGQMLQAFGEKRQEAINQQDIGRAKSAMQAEYMTHLAERDKANPRTWNDDWTKRAQKLRQRFDGDKNLSPYAKDTITADLEGFDLTTSARLFFESSDAIHKENGDMLFAQKEEAKRNGNIPEVVSLNAQLASEGHVSEGRSLNETWKDVNEVKTQQRRDAIATNPREAYEILSMPLADRPPVWQDMGPAQEAEAKSAAAGTLFSKKRELLTLFRANLEAGAIQNMEHVRQFVTGHDNALVLDKGDFEVMKGLLDNTRPLNTSNAWNSAYKAVNGMDLTRPEVEVREEEARLRMQFERDFDGPMKDAMNEMLSERVKAQNDLEASDRKDLADLADRELKRGKLGSITKPKMTPTGELLAKKSTELVIPETTGMLWWKRSGRPEDANKVETFTLETEVDPELVERAEKKKRDAIQKVDAWAKALKDKSEPPTREERVKKFYDYLGATASAGEAESYLNGGTNINPGLFPGGSFKDADSAYKNLKK